MKWRCSNFPSYLVAGASSRNRAWRRVLAGSYIPKLLKVIDGLPLKQKILHETLSQFALPSRPLAKDSQKVPSDGRTGRFHYFGGLCIPSTHREPPRSDGRYLSKFLDLNILPGRAWQI